VVLASASLSQRGQVCSLSVVEVNSQRV